MKSILDINLFQELHKPDNDTEKLILLQLKNQIETKITLLPKRKQKQVTKILKNVSASPQDYVSTFSHLNLIQGSPGGAYSKKEKSIILHPSWAKHPASFLLAIHEFEHVLYFTDRYVPGDKYLKMLFHILFCFEPLSKKIERKAIVKTHKFITENYSAQDILILQNKMDFRPKLQSLKLLKKNNVINLREQINPEKVFNLENEELIEAYQDWEKSVYNQRYISMLKHAFKNKLRRYAKEKLRFYKIPKWKLAIEYTIKLSFWSAIAFSLYKIIF